MHNTSLSIFTQRYNGLTWLRSDAITTYSIFKCQFRLTAKAKFLLVIVITGMTLWQLQYWQITRKLGIYVYKNTLHCTRQITSLPLLFKWHGYFLFFSLVYNLVQYKNKNTKTNNKECIGSYLSISWLCFLTITGVGQY